MPTILCFGDSNTWGHIPGVIEARYPFELRWTGRLQRLLGAEFRIIEEGLNGRTAALDDPEWPGRNGKEHLPMLLKTHDPVDLLIIMLGTNDLKARFNAPPFAIAQGVADLAILARDSDSRVGAILLVAPPQIVKTTNQDTVMTFAGALSKTGELAKHYANFAKELGCQFADAAEWVSSSAIDGVHLDETAHEQMGVKMGELIRERFFPPKV